MPLILFILFFAIPVMEVIAFMQINSLIGFLPTLLGIVVTAVIGAWLVRLQGFKVLTEARHSLDRNELPVEQILHGVCILAAGLFLMTPGYITDSIGFLLLIPPLRLRFGKAIIAYFKSRSNIHVVTPNNGTHHTSPRQSPYDNGNSVIIDGEAVDISDNDDVDTQQRS